VGFDSVHYVRLFIIACLLAAIVGAVSMAFFLLRVYDKSMQLLETEKTNLQEDIVTLGYTHQETLEETISKYENYISALNEQHEKELSARDAKIEELSGSLEELNALFESIDDDLSFTVLKRYWYVFKDAENGSGITPELVAFVDSKCKDWNVNPHWMWAIWWSESNWKIDVDNDKSSARGLGQLLSGTGKYLYENTLGHGSGTYNHRMAYDPFINAELTIAHIGNDLAKGSMTAAVQHYSGGGGSTYYNKAVKNAARYGIKLSDSNATYPY